LTEAFHRTPNNRLVTVTIIGYNGRPDLKQLRDQFESNYTTGKVNSLSKTPISAVNEPDGRSPAATGETSIHFNQAILFGANEQIKEQEKRSCHDEVAQTTSP
jgi:hypothetical protein